MNLTMEQSQEIIKQWLQGPENIYNYNSLTYPSTEQQAYIINQHKLFELCKQYSNQQDFHKFLVPYTDQHKAIIYVMFLAPQYQRILFDLMNINGFHNIIAFYQEFSIFINTQYHLLKENIKQQIYSILKLFLENPLEQLEECFKSFLRIGNIYLYNTNFLQLQQFLGFLFEQFKQITSKPNLAALLFYKYLLILNVDDYYKINGFPLKAINDQLNNIWSLHQQAVMTFGRELLINLQIPISYSEHPHQYLNLTQIKQTLPIAHLIANQSINLNTYKASYQLSLPYEIEQRISIAVFHQITVESVQTSLQMLFERYGYQMNFVGAVIRNIICGYSFDETEITQNKIAQALFIIYEIADLTGEKWPIFLRYIYSDIFFMTKDFKDDHNVQSGLFFLRLMHIKQMYNELQGILWFIFQTFELNDQLKKKVQPQLLAFSQHIIFQKLLDDPNIKDAIKQKIHEYFLKYLCQQFQGPDGVSYSQQQSLLYNVEELDTPFVFEQSEADNEPLVMESSDDQQSVEQQSQMCIEDQETDYQIEVDQSVYKVLEREKIDSIFVNPQSEEMLIRFFNFFNKSIQIDVKSLFLSEITKLILKLYEDQFYDTEFEYPFNCLITLLSINFNRDSFLSDLFESLVQQESFSFNILMLAYFENKIKSQYLEVYLFKSHSSIIQGMQILEQLISQQRFQHIFEEIISHKQFEGDIQNIYSLLLSTHITTVLRLKEKLLKQFSLNYFFIVLILQKIGTITNQSLLQCFTEIIKSIIDQRESQKDMDILLEQVIHSIEQPNRQFWGVFCQVFQNLTLQKRVNEESLLQFFMSCFQYSQKYCDGITEIFLATPNTIKSLIFKALNRFLDKTKDVESIEFIIRHLSKDTKYNFFKNPLQTNLDNYLKQSEKKC